MVTNLDIYKEIRRLQLEGMTSQREAAKQLGISRNTVKKYWEGDIVPWEHKPYTREASVMTPEVVQFVKECLDEDDAVGIKKQRHTARRIYHRLIDEYHFTGSESSVRNLVHDMRAARKISQVFIPLRFMPGDAAQIDWGEATVIMNGEKEKVNLFCARLCHSCAPFVIAYKRQNLESFLDAIIHTFQYYGGVPKRLIFDNARVAVKSGFGAQAAAQDDYSQLAAHYGFDPVFCNPASGNEKGLVENLVGYIRRNVCVPLPKVKNLDELNAMPCVPGIWIIRSMAGPTKWVLCWRKTGQCFDQCRDIRRISPRRYIPESEDTRLYCLRRITTPCLVNTVAKKPL